MSVIERERVTHEVTEADVLERAADLLEEFGWCQNAYAIPLNDNSACIGDPFHGGAQAFCAAGAYARATADLGIDVVSPGDAETVLSNAFGISGGAIGTWNDAPGRTKQEVVAKLRQAAEAARA